jgi:hypothetical protein
MGALSGGAICGLALAAAVGRGLDCAAAGLAPTDAAIATSNTTEQTNTCFVFSTDKLLLGSELPLLFRCFIEKGVAGILRAKSTSAGVAWTRSTFLNSITYLIRSVG